MNSADSARIPVALVYSPHAGSAGRANPTELLRNAGLEVADAHPVSKLSALNPTRLQARWRKAGVRAIVAAGGDGSVGAVTTLAIPADLPIGILPLGTANDIARSLELPEDPAAAANLLASFLASGEERQIDAGELVPAPGAPVISGGHTTGGHFLHALTLGLNVEFARLATDVGQRQRWGKLTYAASAFESLSHFTPLPATLMIEGMEGQPDGVPQTVTTRLALLAAINLPIFGGWLEFRMPTVRENDHLLDFILVEAPTRPNLETLSSTLGNIAIAFVTGEREPKQTESAELPGWRWFRARSVMISTPDPVDITLDGELRGRTPAIARISPRPARVLAPRTRVTARATL